MLLISVLFFLFEIFFVKLIKEKLLLIEMLKGVLDIHKKESYLFNIIECEY